jgi:hypothetical protein
MKWRFWKRRTDDCCPTVVLHHDAEAMQALANAHESMAEGKAHLEEIKARKIRLNKIVRDDNHFAPDLYDIFTRRRDSDG